MRLRHHIKLLQQNTTVRPLATVCLPSRPRSPGLARLAFGERQLAARWATTNTAALNSLNKAMGAAIKAEAVPGRRRPTRMAAGSLARFRYRENSSDSDDTIKDDKVSSKSSSTKIKREEHNSDSDVHIPHDSDNDNDSSLSELSFNSSDDDEAAAPNRKTRARVTSTRTTKSKTTITTISTYSAPAGKRKRAATTTTVATTVTVLPTHKKRTTDSVKKENEDNDNERLQVKREIKNEEEDSAVAVLAATAKRASPRKARKPARVITTKVKREGDETEIKTTTTHVEPPTDWELFYNLVMEMRLPGGPAANAAVDTMGCERLSQESASPRDRRFHTLIALMLSSQTKDTVNAVAMQRLYTELPPHKPGAPGGLNLDNILAVDPALLNQLIWQVGFHNNKTKYIKQAAVILRDQWDGDIPSTAEGLMALPGVGPKMAYLCLAAEHGWNRVEGIGVDVHVHRITNLWGWQKAGSPQAKTPESTRLSLQSWLPKDKWKEINWLLVGFGQAVCLPQGAKCGDCTLGLRGLCRAANRKKVNEGRKRRIEMGEDIEDFDIKDTKDVKDDVKEEYIKDEEL